jgi:hypothetical protein
LLGGIFAYFDLKYLVVGSFLLSMGTLVAICFILVVSIIFKKK